MCKEFKSILDDAGSKLSQHKAALLALDKIQLGKALIEAVVKNNSRKVADLLSKGADVNTPDENYGSALHVACMKGHNKIAAKLLAKGAKTDTKNIVEHPPMDIARSKGNQELITLLSKDENKEDKGTEDDGQE